MISLKMNEAGEAQPGTAEARLVALVEAALSATEGQVPAAAAKVREQVEADPDLLLAVLADDWPDLLERAVRRIAFSPDGKRLDQASKLAAEQRKAKGQPKPVDVQAHLNSVLYTTLIGGRPLALCTKRQVVSDACAAGAEAKRLGIRSRFLELVANAVPKDTAIVKNHVSVEDAQQMWGKATKGGES